LLGSALLTLAARKVALARGVLDLPTRAAPTEPPRRAGGGIAIVLVTTVAVLILALPRFSRWISSSPLRLVGSPSR